ncbi:MAG: hypothetical protein RLZZ165_1244 [Bacteroidota bacterium]|jgi:hypothetical protein
MKNLNLRWTAGIIFSILVLYSGCTNPCKNVDCNKDNGECQDGECNCKDGFFAPPTCQEKLNARFNGTYIIEEKCEFTGLDDYLVYLKADSSVNNSVEIDTLWRLDYRKGLPTVVTMVVNQDGMTFTIPKIKVYDGWVETIRPGISDSAGNTLSFIYRHIPDSQVDSLIDTCTAYLFRKKN